MKKIILQILIIQIFVLSSCMETRYLTERYIKTNVENHTKSEFSSIKTYSIYQNFNPETGSYLEFTGYKFQSKKGLVIGADKYYRARQKFIGDNTLIAEVTYVELDLKECQSILDNYKVIKDRIIKEKTISNEEIYHDYTVSKDLFISYKIGGMNTGTYTIYFWIKGEKYAIDTDTLIKKLLKFMQY